jgi:hypothetical protein
MVVKHQIVHGDGLMIPVSVSSETDWLTPIVQSDHNFRSAFGKDKAQIAQSAETKRAVRGWADERVGIAQIQPPWIDLSSGYLLGRDIDLKEVLALRVTENLHGERSIPEFPKPHPEIGSGDHSLEIKSLRH